MQLLVKFLFKPTHVIHSSKLFIHDEQLIEHRKQLSSPLSINPVLHAQSLSTELQVTLFVPLQERQLVLEVKQVKH